MRRAGMFNLVSRIGVNSKLAQAFAAVSTRLDPDCRQATEHPVDLGPLVDSVGFIGLVEAVHQLAQRRDRRAHLVVIDDGHGINRSPPSADGSQDRKTASTCARSSAPRRRYSRES